MSSITAHAPHGLMRQILHLPTWLYRVHLGWMAGDRLLMLTHIGRRTGLPHQTVIEVVSHDRQTDTYVVASGWKRKSDWFRNIQKTPTVQVNVGRRHFQATAQQLSLADAEKAAMDYAHRHPLAFRELAIVMVGRPLQGTPEDCRVLAEAVPFVAFQHGQR